MPMFSWYYVCNLGVDKKKYMYVYGFAKGNVSTFTSTFVEATPYFGLTSVDGTRNDRVHT
jgi:hypothetical protein